MNAKIREKIIILDGATGTELQKRGMPAGVCPEMWCYEHPDVIGDVHATYSDSGAEIVYTATFGANRIKLEQYGVSEVEKINRKLAEVARNAAGTGTLIAGDIGPTGRFVEPFGDLGFEAAVEIFKEQVGGLLEGGVDLFVIETMMDIQEARAALIAVKELTDKFAMVTMTYEKNGRTLNGTDPVAALITLQSLGADAVGCNCSTGPQEMLQLIRMMKPYATVPLVAKPNAGMPRLVGDKTVFTMEPPEFASYGKQFAAEGVNLLGGCCGTAPDHIRALSEEIAALKPREPVRESIGAVSSARRALILDRDKPLVVIGERINPTGKKILQAELREGKYTLVRAMAREQQQKGADLLDVNVGVPGIDETETMGQVIRLLATVSELPLVIDSSDVEIIEAALRIYPGRALINSISGEEEKLQRLLPVAARYGAMFILLPLAGASVPRTADERKTIVETVLNKAREFGFSKSDVVVDGLVMAVSSLPSASLETLKTIEWTSRVLGCHSVLGLSNVSFGMPERKWLNMTFLAMAIGRGLSMAIANPEVEEIMSVRRAADVLVNRDKDALLYIGHFAGDSGKTLPSQVTAGPLKSPSEKVYQAVTDGNRDDIETLLAEGIASGKAAVDLIQNVMIPAITEVGERFDRQEYFLPQLIAGAEAMKKGVSFLEPYLQQEGAQQTFKGKVLIATVKGDIHDIGKNIVALMLKNHGFEVHDLGKDVAAETIIETAVRIQPEIIALSALMTTTMRGMQDVIELARERGLNCRFMVGGAVVTDSYARSIGACYAGDGVGAVRVAESLLV